MSASDPIASLLPPEQSAARRTAQMTAPKSRPPLPLPRLRPREAGGSARYFFTSLDGSGRLGDRTLVRALNWKPGTRLDIREDHGLIVIAATADGIFRVTGQGFVIVPSAVRRWCHLAVGDQMLVVAQPVEGWLVAHPPAAVDAMVGTAHTAVWGGEDA